MQEEIGSTAGTIWHALNDNGELSLAKLKKEVNTKTPVFDWAVGWHAKTWEVRRLSFLRIQVCELSVLRRSAKITRPSRLEVNRISMDHFTPKGARFRTQFHVQLHHHRFFDDDLENPVVP